MKIIMKVLLGLSVCGFAIAEDIQEGTSALFLKAMAGGSHYYGMVGFGKYDGFGNNAGYFAYEKYGPRKELEDSFENEPDELFYVERFSLKGEAYVTPETVGTSFVTGAKVDIYYGQSEFEGGGYQVDAFGLGMGIVMNPIPSLKRLYLTVGGSIEPEFLALNWKSPGNYQYNWYAEAEFFITSKIAATWQQVSFGVGDSDGNENIINTSMLGLRVAF